ncbi:MAG: aminotransferase class V-fold PLP-dependent enzyme [Phycisphaerales bacterium]|nr:aminotransferase class V-fold PLP-dependent enzyme [Phycisphaerales bacterium]
MAQPAGRIYLDNAATSFPKPACVTAAMATYCTGVGASPGRGAYAESRRGAAVLAACRERLNAYIGGESPSHVLFTLNCSDALNLAIHGSISNARRTRGAKSIHAVTTAMDHNSVLRPLRTLEDEGLEVTRVRADAHGRVAARDVIAAIRPDTALVAMVHASNVTGTLQDVGSVGLACRAAGVPFLVDAAQSLGHVPIDVQALAIDLLAFPAHKGLLGPLGVGGLYIRPGIAHRVDPVRQGGTGSRSESDRQPLEAPDRYEPGSHNMPGIAGLLASLEWLESQGAGAIAAHEQHLMREFLDHCPGPEAGFHLVGPRSPDGRVGVFSLRHERLSPSGLAEELERRYGVLTRAGMHCAPGAHAAVGTLEQGGTCRLSLGVFLTVENIRAACAGLQEIGREAMRSEPQARLGSSIQPASV